MTINAYLNEDYLADIATNEGWRRLAAHIRSTGVVTYPNAHHLVEHGWTPYLSETRKELGLILKNKPPKDKNTLKTFRNLMAVLRKLKLKEDDALVVSDGLR